MVLKLVQPHVCSLKCSVGKCKNSKKHTKAISDDEGGINNLDLP